MRGPDRGRPIHLKGDAAELLVWADPTMLEIVVRNLLDNACKYTPPTAPIEIEVTAKPANNAVEVDVIDHGPGIAPDQMDHIFDRFARGTVSSQNWNRGYGLGLYLARELMRAHNGFIEVENREPGACFTLTLRPVGPEGEMHPIPVDDFETATESGVEVTAPDHSLREEETVAGI